MRVLYGRCANIDTDYERTRAMTNTVEEREETALRVWRPHRQIAFGRRDARSDSYGRAREAARERGYAVREREVGGRAVAYTGRTVAVAVATPVEDARGAIQARYDDASDRLRDALARLGVDATTGEPPDAFCPGTHSLQSGGKIVGIAQRVHRHVAVVAAIVLITDHDAIQRVLDPVYDALGVPFDPDSVGSVARAGGTTDPEAVIGAITDAFAGDRDVTVEHVGAGE
ncbi:lipoate--protein ligase [Halobacteriales archaeon QS_4_62_28]|nr:MAG: lipoate--protein ligase [Halobacteriales archaeon QS_4_62_28]